MFLEVNNFAAFKKKIASLGISYRVKGKNPIKKQVPTDYKFKFAPTNGKSREDVKQEI